MKCIKACFLLAGCTAVIAHVCYSRNGAVDAIFALRFVEFSNGQAIYHVTDVSKITDYTCDGANSVCVFKFPATVNKVVEVAEPEYKVVVPASAKIVVIDQGQFLMNAYK